MSNLTVKRIITVLTVKACPPGILRFEDYTTCPRRHEADGNIRICRDCWREWLEEQCKGMQA